MSAVGAPSIARLGVHTCRCRAMLGVPKGVAPVPDAACKGNIAPQNQPVDKAMVYLAVGLGSALGGMGRFWITGMIGQRFGDAFPWGTILVNVSGSFLIGFFAALAGGEHNSNPKLNPLTAQFFMVGICGGYTTFSSFSLQTLKLIQTGSWPQAGANVALSVVACLAAVWLGHVVGQIYSR